MDAVGRLAGGVAHDFNNLLTVIESHAEFALSPETPDAARRADIEAIQRAANSGAQLTRQLLTFSRKQAIAPSRIDLNDSLRETIGMIRRLVGHEIEVTSVAGNDLAGIWADSVQIQQVLLNLVVNARDAMPHGGRLRFETSNVTVYPGDQAGSAAALPPGRYVRLAVDDNGVGMTPEVRARIFEPFFTTKGPGHGTGLGLASVYGIVKQSNGYVVVESEPGVGTTFELFFPAYLDEAKSAEKRSTGEYVVPGSDAHILVVEDQAPVRVALCRALSRAGYECTQAKDASEATAALARDRTINLIITEMVLPEKSGIELLADIRLTHADIPALILSGFSEASQTMRVPENAAFVEKPVSPRELLRRVREVLDYTG
jgi:two-component system cell cycle sensor histidine kinase/response regulator CckA